MSDQDIDMTASAPLIPTSRLTAADVGHASTTQFTNDVDREHVLADNASPVNPLTPRLLKLADILYEMICSIRSDFSLPPYLQADPEIAGAVTVIRRGRPSADMDHDDRVQALREYLVENYEEPHREHVERTWARAIVRVSYQVFCRKRLLASKLTNANWSQPLHSSNDRVTPRARIIHRMFLKVAREFPNHPGFEHARFEPTRIYLDTRNQRTHLYRVRRHYTQASMAQLASPGAVTLAIPSQVMERYVRYLMYVAEKHIDTRALSISATLPSGNGLFNRERVNQICDLDETSHQDTDGGQSACLNLTEAETQLAGGIRQTSVVRLSRNQTVDNLEPWFYENLPGLVQVIRTLTRGHLCHLNKPS